MPVAIAAVAIILLGAIGIYVAGHVGKSSTGPTATASPSTSPKPSAKPNSPSPTAIQPLPTLEPAAAGQIASVQFCAQGTPCPFTGDTDTRCALAGPCSVDVGVVFTQRYTGAYSYDVMFFDRCTGGAPAVLLNHSDTATNFLIAEPASLLTVQIPSGVKAAYLFVITRTPAVTQSAGLPLGASSC